jgi:large subunit ribosomal protein L25
MEKLEIIGFKRANLGKREANELRFAGSVPSVLYGGAEQIHFHAPVYLFKDLVYTEKPHFVDLTIEGKKYEAKLQEVQFHPVSEMILHADFLLLKADSLITMEIPVKFDGTAPGVVKGGKLNHKLRKLKVKALPKNMPGEIKLDISGLELGKSAKVGDIKTEGFTILNAKAIPIVTVEVPRALKGAAEEGK